MLTLFQCSTLAAWSEVFRINFYGCELYDAGLYLRTNAFTTTVTQYGEFPNYDCYSPNVVMKVVTVVYFLFFTLITSCVILALFISVITMSMFELIDAKRREEMAKKKALTEERQSSGDQKADRMEAFYEGNFDAMRIDAKIQVVQGHVFSILDSLFIDESAEEEMNDKQQHWYHRCALLAHAISQNYLFSLSIVGGILAVGVFEGISTTNTVDAYSRGMEHAEQPIWIQVANRLILGLFTIEIVVKIVSQEFKPLHYFDDGWNCFDFAIVGFSYLGVVGVDLESVTALRCVRLLRVMRLLHSFPALRSVVHSLILAFANVGCDPIRSDPITTPLVLSSTAVPF